MTATARKIVVRFINAMRYGTDYRDLGADHYEEQYPDRVIKQLHCRAAQFGFVLKAQISPQEGWLNLDIVLDLYARRLVG